MAEIIFLLDGANLVQGLFYFVLWLVGILIFAFWLPFRGSQILRVQCFWEEQFEFGTITREPLVSVLFHP